MKKKILLLLLCLLLSVGGALLACGNAGPADVTANSGDGQTETGADTGEDPAPSNVRIVGKDEMAIHAIGELNTKADPVDSHAGLEKYSSLEKSKRDSATLSTLDLAGSGKPVYSRIRKMANGQYIMTFQEGRISSKVLYTVSRNGKTWGNTRVLLSPCDNPVLPSSTMVFMTADLCVCDDGSIVVACAFRGKNEYSSNVDSNGIVIVRSTDSGMTWSEQQIVYVGTCWEPYLLQTSSGELQLYFTQTGHLIAEHGFDSERRSSCVGLLRSSDRGVTWTKPNGYSAEIVMQQFVMKRNGYDYMCDQMPSAIELHDGTIALAAECCNATDNYKISIAYSKDNWATSLGYAETGPADRMNNFISGAGPYLCQFLSGETVLSYHGTGMNMRMGNASARSFSSDVYQPFGEKHYGYWGSTFVDGTHSMLATILYVPSGDTTNTPASVLEVGRLYLNHVIDAGKLSVTVDGKSDEWTDNTDALFIGSETQAQMSVRAATDGEKVYFLVERLDEYLMDADAEAIYLPSEGKTYYMVKIDGTGGISVMYYDGDLLKTAAEPPKVEFSATMVGTVGDKERDTGKVLEISVPLSALHIEEDGTLLFDATLFNKDSVSEKTTTDTFDMAQLSDRATWLRIRLPK